MLWYSCVLRTHNLLSLQTFSRRGKIHVVEKTNTKKMSRKKFHWKSPEKKIKSFSSHQVSVNLCFQKLHSPWHSSNDETFKFSSWKFVLHHVIKHFALHWKTFQPSSTLQHAFEQFSASPFWKRTLCVLKACSDAQ